LDPLLVYLVRHAIAEQRNSQSVDDAARRLTEQGVERMKRNVAALAAMDVELDAIWTSPLVRARQTAELLTPLLRRERRPQIVDALSPSSDHNGLFSQLADTEIEAGLALVGHEPDMGEIGARLLFGEGCGVMTFRKGGVACIEVEADDERPCGVLRWMLTPKQMRAMTSSSKVG